MAITDIFKKEEGKAAIGLPKTAGLKKDKKTEPAKSEAPKRVAKNSALAAKVLKHAHVTEKAARGAEKFDQYVFLVGQTANKIQICRAVESYYGVNVVCVRTINVPGKRKRRGKGIAIEPGYRKAIVKIKKGQTIEVLPQ